MNNKEKIILAIKKSLLYRTFIDDCTKLMADLITLKPDVMFIKYEKDEHVKGRYIYPPRFGDINKEKLMIDMSRIMALIQEMITYDIIDETYLSALSLSTIKYLDKYLNEASDKIYNKMNIDEVSDNE